jgi:hypothetical protein
MGEGLTHFDNGESQASELKSSKANATLTKTPMYTAINAPRYQRQQLIRDLEKDTGRTVCPEWSKQRE